MFVRRHPKHGVIGFPVVSQAVAVRRSSNKSEREAAVVLRNSNNTCHARMIDHHHGGAVSTRKRRGRAHRSHREMQLVIALGAVNTTCATTARDDKGTRPSMFWTCTATTGCCAGQRRRQEGTKHKHADRNHWVSYHWGGTVPIGTEEGHVSMCGRVWWRQQQQRQTATQQKPQQQQQQQATDKPDMTSAVQARDTTQERDRHKHA